MNFVGYIIDFLISYFLQKFLRISNFKEKFSRFYFRCSLCGVLKNIDGSEGLRL